MQISEMQRKNGKMSFVCKILISEFFCMKLSLLRIEYLSSAVKVLTNSQKILHNTKRDFSQLIYVHNDQ